MKTLFFPMTGRFGNLLFQYCFGRAWAEQNGYELCLHPWIGEEVFDIPKAMRPDGVTPDLIWEENMRQNQDSLIYTRKQVREWLKIKPELLEKMSSILLHRKPVTLNLRQAADYVDAGLVTLSRESYMDAALSRGYYPAQIEWETDLNPTRLGCFIGNESASGLGTTWVALPSFYRLMTAKVLFRANSTFSWWAATLGDAAKVYSPVIRSLKGGVRNQRCDVWVDGNWPVMADNAPNTDLFLPE